MKDKALVVVLQKWFFKFIDWFMRYDENKSDAFLLGHPVYYSILIKWTHRSQVMNLTNPCWGYQYTQIQIKYTSLHKNPNADLQVCYVYYIKYQWSFFLSNLMTILCVYAASKLMYRMILWILISIDIFVDIDFEMVLKELSPIALTFLPTFEILVLEVYSFFFIIHVKFYSSSMVSIEDIKKSLFKICSYHKNYKYLKCYSPVNIIFIAANLVIFYIYSRLIPEKSKIFLTSREKSAFY